MNSFQQNKVAFIFLVFLLFGKIDILLSQENPEEEEAIQSLKIVADLKEKPKAKFLSDSIEIGLVVEYALSFHYPENVQVIFPDTSYNYGTFELVDKKYFPTIPFGKNLIDSVVYRLTTFELDSIQTLRLPIYVISEKDCTAVFPPMDTLRLRELVIGDIDTLNFKSNTIPLELKSRFNYPFVILILLILLGIITIIWIFFGRRLLRNLRLYQFNIVNNRFLKEYDRLATRLRIKQSPEDIEKILTVWKKHLEYIENEPFSTYTSKEIQKRIPSQDLAQSLKNIDRAIYGKELSEQILNDVDTLYMFSNHYFDRKQKELQNA